MTSEVAVLNKTAVALAADSKITVDPEGRHKTYDTVNKLFALSKYHPVAVMIFGNAEFMKFSWETIIKLYRQNLDSRSLPTIREYANDFPSTISESYDFSDDDIRESVYNITSSYLTDIAASSERRLLGTGRSLNAREIKAIFARVISDYREYIDEKHVLALEPNLTREDVWSLYRPEIERAVDQTVAGFLYVHFAEAFD
jgi:hypothetical protein